MYYTARERKLIGDTKKCCQAAYSSNFFQFVHFSLEHLGVDKCMEEIKYMFHARNLGTKLRKFIMCANGVSIPTGHLQLKRDIIYLRNREMYVPLIYMRAHLHQGEVCATF
jgi:hypothetical protein